MTKITKATAKAATRRHAAHIPGELIHVDRDTVTIYTESIRSSATVEPEQAETAARAIAGALGGATVTNNNAYAWVVWYRRPPADKGDWHDPGSDHHYP